MEAGTRAETKSGGESVILGKSGAPNVLLQPNVDPSKQTEEDDRFIYTEADMPALEEMLSRLDYKTAIFEKMMKPVPGVPEESQSASEVDGEPAIQIPFWLILGLGGIPAAITGAGVAILVGALLGAGAVSNAYIALILFFGGIVLVATVRVAIRDEASRGARSSENEKPILSANEKKPGPGPRFAPA